MFNDLGSQQSPNSANNAVDDIFAETDKTANGASRTAPSNGANIEAQPAGLSSGQYAGIDPEAGKSGRSGAKLKFILILLLSALILGAGAYLIYSKFVRSANNNVNVEAPIENNSPDISVASGTPVASSSQEQTPVDNSIVSPEPETSTAATATPTTTSEQSSSTSETPAVAAPIDSDGDSLTDTEEQALGTNINLIDSDFDGLSDYEEVKVYKTDPLKADTDGDTYKDGDEVKSGYNPNGTGKLQ